MIDRTEELGLSARLPLVVGGQPVELRVLDLNESDKWLALLNPIDIETDMSTQLMLDLVVAYDVDKVLGTAAELRGRMTKRELNDALNQMVRAEDPFEEASRSVVAASGVLSNMPNSLMFHLVNRLRRASITNGHSPIGASTPSRSERRSRKNGSSSSGPTVTNGSVGSVTS